MPDVNVLVYAHRRDAVAHSAYHAWWGATVNDPRSFALSSLVAVAFVRIVTLPAFSGGPTPLATALAFIDDIIARPNCRLVNPGPDHWSRTASLCRRASATGKLVADAQHAAVAMAEGCTLVTRDSDFRRFEPHGLQWKHLVF